MKEFRVTKANDAATRDPRECELQGSNDGPAWADVAGPAHAGQTWSARLQKRTFSTRG